MHTEDQEEFTGSPTGGNSNTSHPMAAPFRKQGPGLAASPLSPFRLLATIIGAIFMAEVIAMLVVYALGPIPFVQLTLLDAGIMTTLIFPVLYFLSFQPLLRYIQKSQQAEAALVHAMDLQERFFDSIDTLIAYMDRDFNFIRVNEAYARADGRKPEYFIGRNHFDLYPHPENQVLFQRVVETGEAYSIYEKPFEYPEAPERGITYWNWSLLPVMGATGEVEGVVLSLVDVTVRKRAEEKNRQLSRIVEQTADTVVVTDCDGVIEYVNPAFTKLTGYTQGDAIGKTPSVLKSGIHDAQFYKDLWRTILDGGVFQSEIANRKKNGELFYEEKTITPLRDESSNITHFVATGKDISERKKAEDELRKAYEELELRVQSRTEELRFANSELEEEIAYRRRAEDKLQQQAIELELQAEELQAQKMDLVVANEKLIQTRIDLDRAQEVGQIGSWRLDVRRNVLTWSDENHCIFGVPKGTPLTYETFLSVVHPDDREYVDTQWKTTVVDAPYDLEHRLLVDGQVKWVREKAYPEFDVSGNLLGGFGITQDITERVQAEAAIKQSEEKYRSLFDHMSEGFSLHEIILDKDGKPYDYRFLEVNHAFEELTGISRAQALGRTIRELIPAIETQWIGTYGKVALTGEPVHYENYSAALGKWYETFCYSPRKYQFAVLFFDVTERKQVEDQLRYQAALLSNVNDAIVASDAQYRITAWNAAAETLYGWEAEEVIGRNGLDLVRTEWLGQDPDEMRRRITKTGRWRGEATQMRKDGTRFPVEISSMVFYDDHDQVAGYISVNRDITERKRTEQALRQGEERLSRAQEIAHLGSWELDLVKNQLTWSDEVYRIFGLQPQQFAATYEAFLESIHPDDRAAVDQAYSGSIREGKDKYEIEHRVVKRSSGEIRVVHEKCEHFRDNAGKIIRSVGMVHDITEQVLAQAALRESEEKYRTLFENMTEEVHFWQLVRNDSGQIQTWRLVDANPPTLKSWGENSVEEIRGRTSDEILGPGATDHYMPVVQKIMTEGVAYSYEDYFPNLDKYFRFTSVPLGEYFITTGADITSLKKAHEALRMARDELEVRVQERTKELERTNMELLYEVYEREEAERQLRIQITAMEAAANGIIITDPEGTILWSNPALTRMTGYTGEELIGENMRIFNSGQHDPDHYRQMWATILAGDIWQGEMENRRKDGSLYTESQTIASVCSETGELSHFIAIKQDITEHKRMEAALELERIRLKNILDTIPDGVYIINQDYEIEYTNPVIEREFGPVNGRKCYAYFHELSKPCPWCKNEDVFSGMTLVGERTYEKNNKSYEIFDAPFANADGSVSKLKLLHDITQRKKMELALEQNNLELRAATDAERKQRQAAETLRAATQALAQSLDLDTVLNTLLKHVTALVETDIASVGFVEDETRLISRVAQGYGRQTEIEPAPIFPIDAKTDLFFQQVAASHTSLFISDATLESDWIDFPGIEPLRSWLGVPILVNEKVIGVVLLGKTQPGFFNHEHAQTAEALVSQASVAIQNAWLFEQVRAGRERLQLLSRRLVEVQESERRYIARELHDQAGQSLTSLILGLGQLEKGVAKNRIRLAQAGKLKLLASDILEDLHRLAVNLRPASLDHLGLVAALQQLGATYTENEQLEVKFKALGFSEQDRFPAEIETTLYRIVQEALTNVTRHAQATRADVILEQRGDTIVLIVEDNGIGFDTTFSADNEHLGLIGIRERTEMLGGILTVESIIGSGTILVVEVPYADTHLAGG